MGTGAASFITRIKTRSASALPPHRSWCPRSEAELFVPVPCRQLVALTAQELKADFLPASLVQASLTVSLYPSNIRSCNI